MTDVDLLYQTPQRELRAALEQGNINLKALLDESVAALAFIAGHPLALRDAALALISTTARLDLWSYRVLERDGDDPECWRLTALGERAVETLAQQLPEGRASSDERDEAAGVLAEARARLQAAGKNLTTPAGTGDPAEPPTPAATDT